MGIKFGEIEASQILQNEYRIGVLEHLIEWIMNNNQTLTLPSQEQIGSIRKTVVESLQKKYPKTRIGLGEE